MNNVVGIVDIRQSPQWAEYLQALGWSSLRTSKNINIEHRKTLFGTMVKIQKPPALSEEDLKEIEQICLKHRAIFIKIEPYLGQDVTIFDRLGYEISWFPLSPTATYLIDLRLSETDLWNKISHSAKYSVHRAQREGARVKIYRKPETAILQDYYEVLKYTGRIKKLYVPPFKHFMKQVAAFGDNGHLVMVYNKDNVLCGAKWHVIFGDMVLYVSGGTSEIGRDDKSGYELLWKSILYFKSLGLKIYDLEGKDDKRFPNFTKRWGGFSHFKEKFGGQAIEFPHPRVKYIGPLAKFFHKVVGFNV